MPENRREATGNVAPHFAYGTGGLRLLVRKADAQRALAALAAIPEEKVPELQLEDDSPSSEREGDRATRTTGLCAGSGKSRATGLWVAPIILGGAFAALLIAGYLQTASQQRIPDEYEPCQKSWAERRWDDVLIQCGELTRVDPYATGGWAFLSQALSEKGRHAEAIVAARRAASGGTAGWCYLAVALHSAGRVEEAAAAVEHLREREPGFVCDVPPTCPRKEEVAPGGDTGDDSR